MVHILLSLGLISLAGTAAMVWLLMPLLRRIVDTPNARSMHKIPVPRGGGIAVMLVMLAVLAVLGLYVPQMPRSFYPMLFGAALLAGVGVLDDLRGLTPAMRLVTQAIAVGLAGWFLPIDATLFQGFVPLWLDRLILIFGWMWFLNLYNFMDGIDGITGVQSASIGLGIVALSFFVALPAWLPMTGVVAAGCAIGFLVWNWNPARVFLGDSGSVPVGYLLGYALIWLAFSGFPVPAVLIALYYLFDATVTLVLRVSRGHSPWAAHRSHGYQRAVQGGISVRGVCMLIAALNAFLIACAIGATQFADLLAWGLTAMATLATAALAGYFYKKFSDRADTAITRGP